MLKRKIIEELLYWKKNKNKECLFIKGARQIGKTFIVREFGKRYYKNFIEINFFNNPEYKSFFDGNLSVSDIKKRIQFSISNANFEEKQTLILLDEIEFCPNARVALKFFAEDNKYDVIATGSHLSIMYEDIQSFPVGYEKQIEMFALDFEEFLWSKGFDENQIKYLEECYNKNQKVDEVINQKMLKLFKEYIIVGGMPEVVNDYIKNEDIISINEIQKKIVTNYLDDIAKYAKGVEKTKVKNCYLSIPKQLDRENKKWNYTLVDEKGSGRKYENSLLWIQDSKVAIKSFSLKRLEYPLNFYTDEQKFKMYMTDIGLLVYMYGYSMKKKIVDDELKGFTKGCIYESVIADIFLKNRIPLYYYKNDKNSQEIEFVVVQNGNVVPIEVKAGNGTTKSMNEILKLSNIDKGYKLINGNIGVDNKKITLPHYMSIFIAKNSEKK